LFSSVHYPANYGFIPQTYCDDHDPLEHKNIIVEQFMNREKAYEIVLESMRLYQEKKEELMPPQ
jgi:inorganic pyrophosphatase